MPTKPPYFAWLVSWRRKHPGRHAVRISGADWILIMIQGDDVLCVRSSKHSRLIRLGCLVPLQTRCGPLRTVNTSLLLAGACSSPNAHTSWLSAVGRSVFRRRSPADHFEVCLAV